MAFISLPCYSEGPSRAGAHRGAPLAVGKATGARCPAARTPLAPPLPSAFFGRRDVPRAASLGVPNWSSHPCDNVSAAMGVLGLQCMRHGDRLKKLNKPADQRKALLRALTTELIRHGRIHTLLSRAREVRKTADHMITLAKDGSLHARRQALGYIYDKQLVHALFEAAPDRYGSRNGGYTRILKALPRRGDNAPMAVIELV
ncbi:hypothetical protein CDCA_CDCA07G2151 [Cyanidium caldarium]|uniref:Large ribosomal subunit protein bL17c n=1 Tax=Cyanidium caldarium TaxID=2771 RepID=A0AAV9IVP5_CYACA|nr:hypothetical protein CDCA_CDCA07G2151 [Cyanidium caldarium]